MKKIRFNKKEEREAITKAYEAALEQTKKNTKLMKALARALKINLTFK